MPRLRDLEATFLRLMPAEGPSGWSMRLLGDSREGADGIMFLCPKCWAANLAKSGDDGIGTHSVICWFTGVDQKYDPKPGRWNPSGKTIDDLTFVGPGAVSVLLTGGGCGWHGFVKDGSAE
jgi:hypothetical protein